jgi:hypothetical protein
MLSVATVLKCLGETRDQDSKYQHQDSEVQDQDSKKCCLETESRRDSVSRLNPITAYNNTARAVIHLMIVQSCLQFCIVIALNSLNSTLSL